MQKLFVVGVLVATATGCGSKGSFISPEPDGGRDAATLPDGGPLPDGAVPDDGGGPDGSTGPAPGWVSGSRLRARVYEGTDGSKQFVGWYDNQRKENCSIAVAADGKLRCLPEAAYNGVLFTDAQCTVPLGQQSPKGCTAPKYIDVPAAQTCGGTYPRRRFPAGTTTFVGQAYALLNGMCQATTIYPQSIDYFPANGPEIPAGSFADAVEKVE
jgi:hypothetical protein